MKKKTLKDKIKQVYWGASAFTLLYFIIGAYLKSDGTTFDPVKTYDLIKDALTLTATFLAPVAAFTLFDEWRDEHREKSHESLATQIYLNIEATQLNIRKLIEDYLNSYNRDIDFYDRISKQIADLQNQSKELLVISKNVVAPNKETLDFMKLAQKIIQNKIPRAIDSIAFEIQLKRDEEFPEEMLIYFTRKENFDNYLIDMRSFPPVVEDHIGEKLHAIDADIWYLKKILESLIV